MMCKNSHHRIFSNRRNALGSGQEECNRRAVSAGLLPVRLHTGCSRLCVWVEAALLSPTGEYEVVF